MTIEESVYGADLRNRLVPCGGCEEDEVATTEEAQRDEIRRLTALLSNYQEQTTGAVTELTTSLKYIREGVDYQRAFADRMDKRQDEMERKLDQYNNLRERVDLVEQAERNRATDYVPRSEFNGAFKSLRGQIVTMQWIFGIGFAATSGLMTGVLIFLLNGGGV